MLDVKPAGVVNVALGLAESSIDYVVTKIPRFAFEKFPQADPTLTTQIKSVGEAMAIGRTFKESLQKCLRSLPESGCVPQSGISRSTFANTRRKYFQPPPPLHPLRLVLRTQSRSVRKLRPERHLCSHPRLHPHNPHPACGQPKLGLPFSRPHGRGTQLRRGGLLRS